MTDLNTATLERLRGLNVSALATCLFKRGFHNTSMNGIVPVSPTASRMVGPAFTLRLIPSREDLASAMASCPSTQHVQRRVYVHDQDQLARIPWLGEGIKIGEVLASVPVREPKIGTGVMVRHGSSLLYSISLPHRTA